MPNLLNIIKLKKSELKLWLVTYAALLLTYTPFLYHFIWGNHDWMPILKDSSLTSGLIEGRFSQYIFPSLFLMGKILPVITFLLGFGFYTLSLVILYTRFFEFNIKKTTYLPLITAALLPYINEIIYFRFIMLSQLTWPIIITLSLLCGKEVFNSAHKVLNTILCFILLLFAMGGYPASVNLFTTAVTLYLIKHTTSHTSLKNLIRFTTPFIISLICSFICIYVIYSKLTANNLMLNLYNTQYLSVTSIILKIFPTLGKTLLSFIEPQPFFSLSLKLSILLIFIIYIISHIFRQKETSQKLIHFSFILILLLCIKFSAWLSNDTTESYFVTNDPIAFMVRADFYAIPILIMFCIASCLKYKQNFIKNTIFILSLILSLQSLNADFNCTKTQILGFKAETMLQDRIINRIQENKNFNPKAPYKIIQAGEQSLRTKYYHPSSLEKYGYYLLQTPFTRFWIATEHYNFYLPQDFVYENSGIHPEDISPAMQNFFEQKTSFWPSPSSLFIDDKYSIIALTKEGRQMLNTQFIQIKRSFP